MVGEIRDGETASIAVNAALTGHLVLSTLHTNDAPGATVRLVDMGIEPFLAASSVICVLSQRLVRKICNHCRECEPDDEMWAGGPGRHRASPAWPASALSASLFEEEAASSAAASVLWPNCDTRSWS